MFHGIAAAAKQRGAGLIVLDNLAHLFVGNENARRDVAAFCSALDRMAIECDATVIALAHPAKTEGSEFSGSTGWSAHVRQRWFMERPKEALDRDARVLRKSKSNYASSGDEVAFRWHQWAFVRDADLPDDQRAEIAANIQAGHENERFLACLAKATEERRATSPNRTASNYAPRVFAAMTIGKGVSEAGFAAALERLLHLGTIRNGERVYQRDNRAWVTGLALAPTLAPTPAQTLARERTEPVAAVRDEHAPTCTHSPPPYYVGEGGAADGPPPSLRSWADASPDDPDTMTLEDLV